MRASALDSTVAVDAARSGLLGAPPSPAVGCGLPLSRSASQAGRSSLDDDVPCAPARPQATRATTGRAEHRRQNRRAGSQPSRKRIRRGDATPDDGHRVSVVARRRLRSVLARCGRARAPRASRSVPRLSASARFKTEESNISIIRKFLLRSETSCTNPTTTRREAEGARKESNRWCCEYGFTPQPHGARRRPAPRHVTAMANASHSTAPRGSCPGYGLTRALRLSVYVWSARSPRWA